MQFLARVRGLVFQNCEPDRDIMRGWASNALIGLSVALGQEQSDPIRQEDTDNSNNPGVAFVRTGKEDIRHETVQL